jgi:hypothetical protein
MKGTYMKSLNLFATVLVLVGSLSLTQSASADNTKPHPRRKEVNGRLNNQQKRVDNGLANGSLKPGQAKKIQNQDARIKQQEQRDVRQNERDGRGATLTKGQQNQLNREENHTSNEISRDERQNKAAQPGSGSAPAPAAPAAPTAPAAGQ